MEPGDARDLPGAGAAGRAGRSAYDAVSRAAARVHRAHGRGPPPPSNRHAAARVPPTGPGGRAVRAPHLPARARPRTGAVGTLARPSSRHERHGRHRGQHPCRGGPRRAMALGLARRHRLVCLRARRGEPSRTSGFPGPGASGARAWGRPPRVAPRRSGRRGHPPDHSMRSVHGRRNWGEPSNPAATARTASHAGSSARGRSRALPWAFTEASRNMLASMRSKKLGCP